MKNFIIESSFRALLKGGKKAVSFLFLLGCLLPLMMAQEPVSKAKSMKKNVPYLYEEMMKKGVNLSDLDKRTVDANSQLPVKTVVTRVNNLGQNGTKKITILKNAAVSGLSSKETVKGSDRFCTTVERKVDITSDQSAMLKNPADEIVWPGALVDANSIVSGAFSLISKGRMPIALYETRLKYKDGHDRARSNVIPAHAAVLNTMDDILRGRDPASVQPAEGLVYWTEVNRNEDVSVALNISCNSMFADLNGMYTLDEKKATRTFLAGYVQTYYVFNADVPVEPDAFFQPPVPNIPDNWVYVSSVRYGRIALLAINISDYEKISEIDIKAEVNAFIFGDYKACTNIRKSIDENSVSIRGYFYGGNPMDAGKVMIGTPNEVAAQFKQAWQRGMAFNEQNPGLPISYVLRYVNSPNHEIASVQQVLEYTQRECSEAEIYRVTLMDIKCLTTTDQDEWNNPSEIYGKMAAYLFKFNQNYDTAKKDTIQGVTPYANKDNFLWKVDKAHRASLKMGESLPVNKYFEFKADASLGDRPRFYLMGDLWEADVDQLNIDDDDHLIDNRYSKTEEIVAFEKISKDGTPYFVSLKFFSGQSKFTANFKIEAMGTDVEPSPAGIQKGYVRYKVTLENLKGLSNNDQGSRNNGEDIFGKMEVYLFNNAESYDAKNAEIKGIQGVQPLYGDFNYLWWAKSNQRIEDVKKNDVKRVGKTIVFDVDEKSISQYYIYAIGDIWDYDSGNDDNDHFNFADFSQLDKKIPLNLIPKNGAPYPFKLYFGAKEEKRVEANFKIEAFRNQDPRPVF